MTFKTKNAVIYGGGDTVGRVFGFLGERSFLTGDHPASVGISVKDIPAVERVAVAEVEAHDGQAKEAQA